jgi:hypothetical protein
MGLPPFETICRSKLAAISGKAVCDISCTGSIDVSPAELTEKIVGQEEL